MFEKCNPSHPDKIADRIAGAIVDLAYKKSKNPKIAVEVLIGHGVCHIIAETSVSINRLLIIKAVRRIAGKVAVDYTEVPQDKILAKNQKGKIRCGDNGIFKGVPTTQEQYALSGIAKAIYQKYPYDGKYILTRDELIICQSNAKTEDLQKMFPNAIINPLGDWIGGTEADTGATNRKLGSDMGDAVTGGGLHGKDLSKADVSINIFCHILAQKEKGLVQAYCAIGDETVNVVAPTWCGIYNYEEIVETAKQYIKELGGFEKLAEWGLI